jgi:hypothetical protein
MTAEVIPFPLHATSTWRSIEDEYCRRRDKAGYARKVIAGNVERMKGLGVSPDRIAKEVSNMEIMFFGHAGRSTDEKARANGKRGTRIAESDAA